MSGRQSQEFRKLCIKLFVVIAAIGFSACRDAAQDTHAVPPSERDLVISCGDVPMAPYSDPPVLPFEPLSAENLAVLDSVPDVGELGIGSTNVVWSVVDEARNELTLFGRFEGERHSYVTLNRSGDKWELTAGGTCHLKATADGWSEVLWVLDPDVAPDPLSSELSILINEQACNSGQPPAGRDVEVLVVPSAEQLRIHVFVEPRRNDLGFDQTCLTNPWYPVVIDLGESMGDKMLLDGVEFPPVERTWPPTQSLLTSFGRSSP